MRAGAWARMAPPGTHPFFITSPLTRALQTAAAAFQGLDAGNITAAELCRARLGRYPCDARRAVHDPPFAARPKGPCAYTKGLHRFLNGTNISFPITDTNLSYPITPAQVAPVSFLQTLELPDLQLCVGGAGDRPPPRRPPP